MSTIDTSTWNPDPALNESIGDIPLNANASIQQTWQAIQMLMAAGGLHGLQLVAFDGATASADGASGLVPKPEAGDQDKVLKGDGTWGIAPAASSVAWSDVTGKPSSFTPSSHAHGNITNAGAIGSTSGLPVVTGANGVLQVGSFGATAGTVCEGSDSRLSDARTPTSHTHGSITNDGKLGTESRAVVTGVDGAIAVSSVTATELGYLSGVTSAVFGVVGLSTIYETPIDLNSVKKHGFYNFSAGTSVTNAPSGVVNGFLIVLANSAGGQVKQIFFRIGTNNTNDFQTFVRTSSGSTASATWSDWKRFAVHNESTFELSGTTTFVKVKNTKVESLGSIPASNSYTGISGCTAGGNSFGEAQFIAWTSGSVTTRLAAIQNVASSPVSKYADLTVRADGTSDFTTPTHLPEADNSVTLGNASKRWKEAWLNAGAINTSDERLKASIGSIPDAVLDAWGDVGWCQYQFKDAVEKKGESARLHNGLIAQRIDAVFKTHGLDASAYGLFCYDKWDAVNRDESFERKPAVLDDAGNEVEPAVLETRHVHEDAGDMYSLRYEEALAMEAAYQRRENVRLKVYIASLEERLAVFEARIRALEEAMR